MSAYHKLPVAAKTAVAIDRQREQAVACPRCAARCMPRDLMQHMDERCTRELPAPHVSSRWLTRVQALRLAPSSRLDEWVQRELLRQRPDGTLLECDLVVLVAWSRALEVM